MLLTIKAINLWNHIIVTGLNDVNYEKKTAV